MIKINTIFWLKIFFIYLALNTFNFLYKKNQDTPNILSLFTQHTDVITEANNKISKHIKNNKIEVLVQSEKFDTWWKQQFQHAFAPVLLIYVKDIPSNDEFLVIQDFNENVNFENYTIFDRITINQSFNISLMRNLK